ncbi:uncharacterized protein ACNS7B_011365 isoform 3-T3 [Menidia menidia]
MGLVFSWLWGQRGAQPVPDIAADTRVIPTAEVPEEVHTEKEEVHTETEILPVEAADVKTDVEQMHAVCETVAEGEAEEEEEAGAVAEEESVTEAEVEAAATEDVSEPETLTETIEEAPVEELSADQVSEEPEAAVENEEAAVESVIEADTQTPEPQADTEASSIPAPAQEPKDGGEVEVLGDEEAAVPAEPVTNAEDAAVQLAEVPAVPETIPEAPVNEAEAPVIEASEVLADTLVDDFIVTESASAVEGAIAASVVHQEIETIDAQAYPDPEPAVAAPEEKAVTEAAVENTCLETLSEEPKPEICEMPCQMQLSVESVPLSSTDISVETALNGHMVPEVSIEG